MPADNSIVPAQDTTPATSFARLGVPAPLVDVLDGQGISAPFPVQAATLPDALAGRDILGLAQTGSGKTLAFSLPMVARLADGSTASGRPRGLVLVPTRELATQVTEVLRPLARSMGLRVVTIYGGVSYGPQVNALQHKTEIVVATPGRLADLIGQGECDLSEVQVTVIDEADQMADLGFLPIVRRLLETTPQGGQRMLFSATLDNAVDVIARRFLSDPALHSVDENSSPAEIEHHVLTVDGAGRIAVVAALAGGEQRSLVFTKTKHGAERLARQLTEAGIPAAELHGNLRQGARSRNLAAFASGLARVMVATDVAARGIHIDGIDLIIHADPPAEHKSYLHRSGRTARGGADGVVVTLQTKGQVRDVTAMMRKAGITPHAAVVADAGSDAIAAIAGSPAPRVTVDGKVSELVQPEDRLMRNDRRGVGKPGEGRPRRDRGRERQPRDDRFSGRAARDFGARDFGRGQDGTVPAGRAAVRPNPSERQTGPGRSGGGARLAGVDRGERGDRFVRGERGDRFDRGDRDSGFDRGDRNPGFDRGGRNDRAERYNPGNNGNQGNQGLDRGNRNDRAEHNDPGNRGGRYSSGDRAAQGDRRNDRAAQGDRFDRGDRGGRFDRSERSDRGDQSGRSGRNDGGGYDWWPRSSGRPAEGGYRRPGSYRDNRSYRDEPAARDSRAVRDDRGSRDDRPYSGERGARPQAGGRPQPTGRPRGTGRPQGTGRTQPGGRPQSGGQSFRPRAASNDRSQADGHFGGSSRRPGYSAGRGPAGKRRG
jgi:superfamily II DNA/RNA helicase